MSKDSLHAEDRARDKTFFIELLELIHKLVSCLPNGQDV